MYLSVCGLLKLPLFLARKFRYLARDAHIKSHTAEKKSLADTEDFQRIKHKPQFLIFFKG